MKFKKTLKDEAEILKSQPRITREQNLSKRFSKKNNDSENIDSMCFFCECSYESFEEKNTVLKCHSCGEPNSEECFSFIGKNVEEPYFKEAIIFGIEVEEDFGMDTSQIPFEKILLIVLTSDNKMLSYRLNFERFKTLSSIIGSKAVVKIQKRYTEDGSTSENVEEVFLKFDEYDYIGDDVL